MARVTAHLYDDTLISYEEIGQAADAGDVEKLFAYAERLEAQLRASDAVLADMIYRGPVPPLPRKTQRFFDMATRRHQRRLERCEAILKEGKPDDETL